MTTAVQSRRHKKPFLDAFRSCGNISHACRLTGVGRQTVTDWRKADSAFAAAYLEAELEAADLLETEARRRAVEGTTRVKFGPKGEPLIDPETGKYYAEREYSDTLLIFLMKGANPQKYPWGNGNGAGPSVVVPVQVNITLQANDAL